MQAYFCYDQNETKQLTPLYVETLDKGNCTNIVQHDYWLGVGCFAYKIFHVWYKTTNETSWGANSLMKIHLSQMDFEAYQELQQAWMAFAP
jgi:hypothetical protein